MLQNSTYSEPEFQKLVATLAKLQGKPNAGLIEVVEKEVQFLTNKVREISQLRKVKMSIIKRKLDSLTEESNQIINSAQNFAYEIDKSLKQSERQCFKRIQRLQRDRMQKQIEIKTIIDQQVLEIVQQSAMTNQLGSEFAQLNQSIQDISLQFEIWLSEMRNHEAIKQSSDLSQQLRFNNNIFKEKDEKINSFKTRVNKMFKSLQQRLQRMKRQRQRWEGQSLKQIQEIVEALMIRRH